MLGKTRILIYSDDERFSENGDEAGHGGMSIAIKLIKFKLKPLMNVDIVLLNRHPKDEDGKVSHALNKLTADVLNQFDVLWVFGYKKVNTDSEPENELTEPEVNSLKEWMDAGHGIMVTGDHSEQTPVPLL